MISLYYPGHIGPYRQNKWFGSGEMWAAVLNLHTFKKLKGGRMVNNNNNNNNIII